ISNRPTSHSCQFQYDRKWAVGRFFFCFHSVWWREPPWVFVTVSLNIENEIKRLLKIYSTDEVINKLQNKK
ncbi:hypothetical protein, partial [Enterococcus sp. CWB-B31]|uniref:hypothetical protein n=1 Tax=Enterococcus sp. CWB-B31 TaxID=2885159 RepID=UPI001E460DB3